MTSPALERLRAHIAAIAPIETAEERYEKVLVTAPWIVHRVPQRYLASYLGIKPQSLSRIRKKARDGGSLT